MGINVEERTSTAIQCTSSSAKSAEPSKQSEKEIKKNIEANVKIAYERTHSKEYIESGGKRGTFAFH